MVSFSINIQETQWKVSARKIGIKFD
jgi:hypothetical protein